MHFSAVYRLRRYLMEFRRQGAWNKAAVGKISSFLSRRAGYSATAGLSCY